MDIKKSLPFLKSLAKCLAVHFGENCEVVVHDLSGKDAEHTIVAIENGHVSKRTVGDRASKVALEAMRNGNKPDRHSYHTRTESGHLVKSSTVYIRGDNGEVEGLFCINYDTTMLSFVQNEISAIVDVKEEGEDAPELLSSHVADLFDRMLEESEEYIGKPANLMNKEDKIRAVQFLDSKGAFLIKFAGDKATKFFNISKFTLYNYLKGESE